jgi:hypothetical protein
MSHKPALSVSLHSPKGFKVISKTLHHLANQTRASELEILISCPNASQMAIPSEIEACFWGVHVFAADNLYVARAVCMRQAQAPLLAYVEDHVFPAENWADVLIQAHTEDYAVVGPSVRNANPRTHISRAQLAMEYGLWLDAQIDQTDIILPGHNSCYKRALILEHYADDLEQWLAAETVLFWDLMRRGYHLHMTARTHIYHLNYTQWGPSIATEYYTGWQFAAERRRGWPWWKCLAYALGSPAIPILRFIRTYKVVAARQTQQSYTAFTWLAVLVLLVPSAIGEARGYLFGEGQVTRHIYQYEVDRLRFVTQQEHHKIMSGDVALPL